MGRNRHRNSSRSHASSSDDEQDDDTAQSAGDPGASSSSPSLKYVPGSTGKQARARAKLLRNEHRRRKEASRARREGSVEPDRSASEGSNGGRNDSRGCSGDAVRKTGVLDPGERERLRFTLERASSTERAGDATVEYEVESLDDDNIATTVRKEVDAREFVRMVRGNSVKLSAAEKVTTRDGEILWRKLINEEIGDCAESSMRRLALDDMADAAPRDAMDTVPAEVWERIFQMISLRDGVRLAATCKSLWVLSHRSFVVDFRFKTMFGAATDDGTSEISQREMLVSYLSSERWLENAHLDEVSYPQPHHFGVGPSFVRGLIADETTVTSFDREKVKIWYHGANIRRNEGNESGGRLASLTVEKKSSAMRGLTALAVNQTSIVAGDDGGRLRIWQSDTLEYVQKKAHAIVNEKAVSALCGVPATSLVVAASASNPELAIWDTEEVQCVTSVDLADLVGDRGGGHGVSCMAMFGGNSYGRNRTHLGATSRIWAGTTFEKIVGVDLNRATFVDTLHLPEHYQGVNAEICALSVNGPLVTAVLKGIGAVMWDRRGMPQDQIIATYESPFPERERAPSEQSSCVYLEDFALWMSNPGDPGVAMFDIRKTFGPPRRLERWAKEHSRYAITSILSPRLRTRGFSEEVNVGCFARVPGELGAVVVAPDAESSEARCSIFSHKNVVPSVDEINSLNVDEILTSQWQSRRSRKGKPPVPKSRGRFPKLYNRM